MPFLKAKYLLFQLAVWAVLLNGCISFGPNTVQNDRMGYVTAISDSLKTQMLLNLVKLRYGDMPIFMDVSSVINQYGLEGQVSLTHNWPGNNYLTDNSTGATGRYYDRPTITYSPMTGDKFTRSLMTPIPPGVVLNFIQSGKSSDFMLRLCVQSMNGIRNQGTTTPADPCFVRLINLIGEIQEIGGVVLKFGDGKNKGVTYLVITQPEDANSVAPRSEIRSMLKLKPDATEVTVVYGGSPSSDTEVAMVTRSVFDIMVQVALSAEVPQRDIDEGRAYPSSPCYVILRISL
jgi:hypothetical protein